jgi:hypothetical protein
MVQYIGSSHVKGLGGKLRVAAECCATATSSYCCIMIAGYKGKIKPITRTTFEVTSSQITPSCNVLMPTAKHQFATYLF